MLQSIRKAGRNYVQFTQGQIMELLGGDYGKIDILWLDGGWVQKMTKEEVFKEITAPDYKFTHVQNQDIRMDELVAKARQKQPGSLLLTGQYMGKTRIILLLKTGFRRKLLLTHGSHV